MRLIRKDPLVLIALIFIAVVCSAHLTSNLYAGYRTSASGSDSARVAKFEVSAIGSDTSSTIDLNDSARLTTSYSFTVTSNSEVTCLERVTVSLSKALPTGVSMEMTVSGNSVSATKNGNTYTYETPLPYGPQDHLWVLTFTGDPDSVTATETADISVDVHVDVIQVN